MKYKLRSILQPTSLTFFIKHKDSGHSNTITFTDTHPNFWAALDWREVIAITDLYLERNRIDEEDYKDLLEMHDVRAAISKWSDGNLTVTMDTVLYDGKSIPESVESFLLDLFYKDPNNTEAFSAWSKYIGLITDPNVSFKVSERLFLFLSKNDLTITPDGHVLAWKVVRPDYKDKHSGTFDNSPGQVLEMPRNKVNDDDSSYCSYGFHVCSWGYLGSFSNYGDRVVQVKIHPADIVAIPLDYNGEKIRVCKYEVSDFVGFWGTDVDRENLPKRLQESGFSAAE